MSLIKRFYKVATNLEEQYLLSIDGGKVASEFAEQVFEETFGSSDAKKQINKVMNNKFDEFKNHFISVMKLDLLLEPEHISNLILKTFNLIKDNKQLIVTQDIDEEVNDYIFPNVYSMLDDIGFEWQDQDGKDEDELFNTDPYFVIMYYSSQMINWVKIMAKVLNNQQSTPQEFIKKAI
ncbi:MAG: hypothetical protein LC122_14105 [Chitinophagales bacterium]|nr:hypothetical protein [Chitinophagales bacterium]